MQKAAVLMNPDKNVKMRKAAVPDTYPPEEGCFLRGNDNSPAAVAVILKWHRDKTPPEIEALVRAGIESGAALSGTLQTENVGLEKVICNIIANPNIRYLIVCGPESPGHLTGESIGCLMKNGLDDKKRIIGTNSPAPYLANIPADWVERFRQQVTHVDLINEGDPGAVRDAVWSCYQENPVDFRGYQLHDPGAFDAEPIVGKITWKITGPYHPPENEKEQAAVDKMQKMVETLKLRSHKRS